MGVFDGHAGAACAQVLAKRLFSYVEASLLPKDKLNTIIRNRTFKIVESINDHSDFVSDLKEKYDKSFFDHLVTLSHMQSMDKKEAIEYSFLKLDEDISKEGEHEDGEANKKGITVRD